MIVTCESCGTKYRLDPERIKKDQTKVRCSQCGHVFYIPKPGTLDQDDILTELSPRPKPEKTAYKATTYAPSAFPAAGASYKKKKSPLKWIFLVLFVVIAVGIGTIWIIQSGWIQEAFKATPAQKTINPKSQLQQITIQNDIQAFFLQNMHAGQIFVVQGEVVNESSKPISFVLVEGKLYSINNQVLGAQRCYCGNVLSREELMQMEITGIQNVMMNREGKDLSNVHIPPQGRVPFMIVFHNLPEMDLLNDYSVEVVSAEFD